MKRVTGRFGLPVYEDLTVADCNTLVSSLPVGGVMSLYDRDAVFLGAVIRCKGRPKVFETSEPIEDRFEDRRTDTTGARSFVRRFVGSRDLSHVYFVDDVFGSGYLGRLA